MPGEARHHTQNLGMKMFRSHLIALLLALLAVVGSAWVGKAVFERIPHLEDEFTYAWEADVLSHGQVIIPSPPSPQSFLVPFVIDYEGRRFGKYPLGWPLVLSLGVLAGARWLVNPLLAGLGVWLTYLLGKKVFDWKVGLLAAGLTVTSPFVLLNSGSLLSHPLGLVLSASFALVFLHNFGELHARRRWLLTLGAALLVGGLIVTRPFTAVGVVLPFAFYGIYLLWHGDRQTRVHLIVMGFAILALSSLHFLWQMTLTGNPLLDPYTLWWSYDRIGFGPGIGVLPGGHTLYQAYVNTSHSLETGWSDFFGWQYLSWLFLPFGLWAARRNHEALLLGSVFISLVVIYMAYWVGSDLFGPRYYYEGFYSVSLFTAAGIFWLAGRAVHPELTRQTSPLVSGISTEKPNLKNRLQNGFSRLGAWGEAKILNPLRCRIPLRLIRYRTWLVAMVVLGLLGFNLAIYLPQRLQGMSGLYQIRAEAMAPFKTPSAQAMTPALIIVHAGRWMYYGALLELEDPYLTTPFIFALSRSPEADQAAIQAFPNRQVYHYYTDEPGKFYTNPKP
jgi:hypothetical protein